MTFFWYDRRAMWPSCGPDRMFSGSQPTARVTRALRLTAGIRGAAQRARTTLPRNALPAAPATQRAKSRSAGASGCAAARHSSAPSGVACVRSMSAAQSFGAGGETNVKQYWLTHTRTRYSGADTGGAWLISLSNDKGNGKGWTSAAVVRALFVRVNPSTSAPAQHAAAARDSSRLCPCVIDDRQQARKEGISLVGRQPCGQLRAQRGGHLVAARQAVAPRGRKVGAQQRVCKALRHSCHVTQERRTQRRLLVARRRQLARPAAAARIRVRLDVEPAADGRSVAASGSG